MRNTRFSSNVPSRMRLRERAVSRSRPKGFSTITRAPSGAQPELQLFDHLTEQQRWNGKIMSGPLRLPQYPLHSLERGCIAVIAVHVAQQSAQLRERTGIDAAVPFETLAHPRLELLEPPAALGHADNRNVQCPALHHRLQRGEDLLVGEIAGRAEEDQGIAV